MSKIQSESNSQLNPCNRSRNNRCGSDVKDTIWKQFTTHVRFALVRFTLWFRCQRYNLKAIHNKWILIFTWNIVVVPMSKIQSESNSQQGHCAYSVLPGCGSDVKDTIWKQFTTGWLSLKNWHLLWFRCQRYNLKAIHNTPRRESLSGFVVVPMSKIQSESNSQPLTS